MVSKKKKKDLYLTIIAKKKKKKKLEMKCVLQQDSSPKHKRTSTEVLLWLVPPLDLILKKAVYHIW